VNPCKAQNAQNKEKSRKKREEKETQRKQINSKICVCVCVSIPDFSFAREEEEKIAGKLTAGGLISLKKREKKKGPRRVAPWVNRGVGECMCNGMEWNEWTRRNRTAMQCNAMPCNRNEK